MGFLRDRAKKLTSQSELIAKREKMSMDDIIKVYPDGVSINAFDIISTKEGICPAFTFKEDDTKFFFGGLILNDIVNDWLKDGSIEEINKMLADEPVVMKFERRKSQAGKNYTAVEVI